MKHYNVTTSKRRLSAGPFGTWKKGKGRPEERPFRIYGSADQAGCATPCGMPEPATHIAAKPYAATNAKPTQQNTALDAS
jgi:hypothetical protein